MTFPKSRWVLTRQAFDRLLDYLDSDRERAAAKYEAIRARLVQMFEWRKCRLPDALADETFDRVSRKIEQGEHIEGEPIAYFYGVARNVFREYSKQLQKEDSAIAVGQGYFSAALDKLTDKDLQERLNCLDKCVAALSPRNLQIITKYYQSEKAGKIRDRRDLARDLGISHATLRMRTHRIRCVLESCVNRCMSQNHEK